THAAVVLDVCVAAYDNVGGDVAELAVSLLLGSRARQDREVGGRGRMAEEHRAEPGDIELHRRRPAPHPLDPVGREPSWRPAADVTVPLLVARRSNDLPVAVA